MNSLWNNGRAERNPNRAVAAAASLPSSLTSINDLCLALKYHKTVIYKVTGSTAYAQNYLHLIKYINKVPVECYSLWALRFFFNEVCKIWSYRVKQCFEPKLSQSLSKIHGLKFINFIHRLSLMQLICEHFYCN